MIYDVSVILSDVRKTLERNEAENGVLSQDADTLTLDAIIVKKLLEAAEAVLVASPLRLIDSSVVGNFTQYDGDEDSSQDDGESGDDDTSQDDSESGDGDTSDDSAPQEESAGTVWMKSFPYPSDFLRMYVIRFAHWKAPVREYVLDNDEAAMTVESEFEGIRPNVWRPLCVMRDDGRNPRCFMCYPQDEYSSVKVAQYVKIPKYQNQDNVSLPLQLMFPELLYRALVYETAGLVEATYKNVQSAQMFFGLARGAMGIVEEERAKGKVQGS